MRDTEIHRYKHRITQNAGETKAFGRDLAKSLKNHDIIALSGELGAGKTTFIQGIAEGLGITDYVTSPSFTLINEYKGKYSLYHIDLYRLEELEQIRDLGIEDYFEKDGIIIIEWAERMKELLPKKVRKIKLEIISENERRISSFF